MDATVLRGQHGAASRQRHLLERDAGAVLHPGARQHGAVGVAQHRHLRAAHRLRRGHPGRIHATLAMTSRASTGVSATSASRYAVSHDPHVVAGCGRLLGI